MRISPWLISDLRGPYTWIAWIADLRTRVQLYVMGVVPHVLKTVVSIWGFTICWHDGEASFSYALQKRAICGKTSRYKVNACFNLSPYYQIDSRPGAIDERIFPEESCEPNDSGYEAPIIFQKKQKVNKVSSSFVDSYQWIGKGSLTDYQLWTWSSIQALDGYWCEDSTQYESVKQA